MDSISLRKCLLLQISIKYIYEIFYIAREFLEENYSIHKLRLGVYPWVLYYLYYVFSTYFLAIENFMLIKYWKVHKIYTNIFYSYVLGPSSSARSFSFCFWEFIGFLFSMLHMFEFWSLCVFTHNKDINFD